MRNETKALVLGLGLLLPNCAVLPKVQTPPVETTPYATLTSEQEQNLIEYVMRLSRNTLRVTLACSNQNITDGWSGVGVVVDTVTLPNSGQKFQMILTAGHVTPPSPYAYEVEDKDCSQDGGFVVRMYNPLKDISEYDAEWRGVAYTHDHPTHDLGVIFVPYTDKFDGIGKSAFTDDLCSQNTMLRTIDQYGYLQSLFLDGEWTPANELPYLKDIVDSESPLFNYAGVQFLEFATDGELPPGSSGSPVLDRTTDNICGVHTHHKYADDGFIWNKIYPELLGITQGGLHTFIDEAEKDFIRDFK